MEILLFSRGEKECNSGSLLLAVIEEYKRKRTVANS